MTKWHKYRQRNYITCGLVFMEFIKAIKSSKMRWAGHVTRMDEMRNGHKILIGKTWMEDTIYEI
jgi:hypothetical protein